MKNLLINSGIKLTPVISRLLAHRFVQTFLCSWLIALGAYITIPFYPVPMTLQTFVIALISLLMPFHVAIGSLTCYVTYAAIGIPVLAEGSRGITALVGPTAGYIIGFFLMSAIISLLANRYPTSGGLKRFLFTLIGGVFLFSIGLAHLSHLFGWSIAIKTGLLPFVFSEPVKFLLAAYLSVFIRSKTLKR
ncbi:MAG: hypothetical protein BGO68_02105 [Candidatus Amoebophilus sp. 36-38]|nr:MAG: hypothetical protein BGO68_02105 [Candidatus Amoebophilus sp. 36-38]